MSADRNPQFAHLGEFGDPPTSLALKGHLGRLLQHGDHLLTQAEKSGRGLTEKETARFNEITAEAEAVKREIAAVEAEDQATARAILSKLDSPRVEATRFAGRLTAFEQTPKGEADAYAAGQWLRATIFNDQRAHRFCAERGMKVDVFAAHSGGSNATGGALVPEELERAVIRLTEEYGVFRRYARTVPMSSDSLSIPRRTGGLTSYFIGENSEGTESDTSWDSILLSPKKLMVLTRMSSEIAEDAIISLADFLAMEVASSFALKEDQCGFLGDGTSTYGGMQGLLTKLEAQTGYVGYVNAASGTDTFAEITADDITSLMSKLPEYAERNAKWYVSKACWSECFISLAMAAGGATMAELQGGLGRMYMGYPVVVSQVLPTASLNNRAMILFGDLSLAATMGIRRGLRFATTDARYWAEDQIGVKGTERFDIVNHDIGSAAVAGPIVALIGNT